MSVPFDPIHLPVRQRDDFNVELYTDAESKFRWHMTPSADLSDGTTPNIAAAATEGFDTLPEALIDCYVATGWLPDGYQLYRNANSAANVFALRE